MIDVEKLVDGIHDYLERALRPLTDRLKAVEAREPLQGEKGEPGQPGKDAEPVTLEDVGLALYGMVDDIKAMVADIYTADPPQDGADGKDGVDGRDGKDAEPVEVADVVQAMRSEMEAEHAKWALQWEQRAQGMLERAIDRIPKPENGKDGKDGFSLEDFECDTDDAGNVTLRFARGDLVKERQFRVPGHIYRGVWEEGAYQRGDTVSQGGSLWIALCDDPQGRPGKVDGQWQMAVKHGRDGHKGKDGKDGEKGAPGRDLRAPYLATDRPDLGGESTR